MQKAQSAGHNQLQKDLAAWREKAATRDDVHQLDNRLKKEVQEARMASDRALDAGILALSPVRKDAKRTQRS